MSSLPVCLHALGTGPNRGMQVVFVLMQRVGRDSVEVTRPATHLFHTPPTPPFHPALHSVLIHSIPLFHSLHQLHSAASTHLVCPPFNHLHSASTRHVCPLFNHFHSASTRHVCPPFNHHHSASTRSTISVHCPPFLSIPDSTRSYTLPSILLTRFSIHSTTHSFIIPTLLFHSFHHPSLFLSTPLLYLRAQAILILYS